MIQKRTCKVPINIFESNIVRERPFDFDGRARIIFLIKRQDANLREQNSQENSTSKEKKWQDAGRNLLLSFRKKYARKRAKNNKYRMQFFSKKMQDQKIILALLWPALVYDYISFLFLNLRSLPSVDSITTESLLRSPIMNMQLNKTTMKWDFYYSLCLILLCRKNRKKNEKQGYIEHFQN